jgi:hypothetical protein
MIAMHGIWHDQYFATRNCCTNREIASTSRAGKRQCWQDNSARLMMLFAVPHSAHLAPDFLSKKRLSIEPLTVTQSALNI